MNFLSFLRYSKTASAETSKKIFVMGNEAGDSIISSLSLAYLEQLMSESIRYIPLLNIARDDLSLRGEICWAFERFGVDSTNLVFVNDLDLEREKSSVILDRIIGIYDHHKDEKHFPLVKPRLIEPVGSCSSLITLEWIQSNFTSYLSTDISSLLLSAILIDTINLQEAFGRTTAKDKEAAEYLMKNLNLCHEDASILFHDLQKAKNDLHNMSSRDLVRKDHKRWIMDGFSVGISSVTWSIAEWKQRDLDEKCDDWIGVLKTFINSLDVFCIMTAFSENDIFCRELFVYFHSKKILQNKFIESLMNSDLGLEIIEKDNNWWHFRQKNIKCSRKQVQPLISTILGDISRL